MDAVHFVMVVLHEQVPADTTFSEARFHISLSGAIQTECGPLEKGMASHFSILALRIP